jgi:hypothetical protein
VQAFLFLFIPLLQMVSQGVEAKVTRLTVPAAVRYKRHRYYALTWWVKWTRKLARQNLLNNKVKKEMGNGDEEGKKVYLEVSVGMGIAVESLEMFGLHLDYDIGAGQTGSTSPELNQFSTTNLASFAESLQHIRVGWRCFGVGLVFGQRR